MRDLIGIYYEPGKEPPPEGPPKLHLLVEHNDEWRVSIFFALYLERIYPLTVSSAG